MPEICPIYARDMPEICTRYARDMPEICPRYAQDIPKICTGYARHMPKMCQDMPQICPRYARDMPKISPRYARDMSMICPRCAQVMPEICGWWARGLTKSQKSWLITESLYSMDPRDSSASKNLQMDDLTTIRLGGVDENYLWRSVSKCKIEFSWASYEASGFC